MSERLLKKVSVSSEAELSVIKALQVECGMSAVSKLKTMMGDFEKSASAVIEYTNEDNSVEF